jgi:hypothetical protein
VKPKHEPLAFKSCFFSWEDKHSLTVPKLSELLLAHQALTEYSRNYTLDELLKKPETLDQTQLEQYLSNEEFLKVFGCTKEEFSKLSIWKQKQKKQEKGLY